MYMYISRTESIYKITSDCILNIRGHRNVLLLLVRHFLNHLGLLKDPNVFHQVEYLLTDLPLCHFYFTKTLPNTNLYKTYR